MTTRTKAHIQYKLKSSPYAYKDTHGTIYRKWVSSHGGYTELSTSKPDADEIHGTWKQVPLSAWDYSGMEVVEYEPQAVKHD